MNFDPFSPWVATAHVAGFILTFWTLDGVLRAYQAEIQGTSDLVDRVVSNRNRFSTLFSPDTIERIDREIQRTRSALADLGKMIDLNNRTRSGAQDIVTKIKWILKHKTAKAHMKVVRQCHKTLLQISFEMALEGRNYPFPGEVYFQETNARMFVALARRFGRHK